MKAMGQRAWKVGTPLEMIELPDPTPDPGEIRVRVAAIGVNPVDWKMRSGGPLRLALRALGPPLPFVPGVDFAGTVDAIGRGVTAIKVGDRVVGGCDFSRGQRGSYADTVISRPDQVATLPDNVTFESAGATPVAGVTAWMCLMEIGKLGTRNKDAAVLVLGAAGGVGQFAVQIAKMAGARVVGVCSGKNAELVRSLGADNVLDYTKGDALAQAKGFGPYQVIVDCVGEYSASACRAMLRSGGRHVIVAGEKPSAMAQVLVPPFTTKSVLGVSTTTRLRALMDAMGAGKIRVGIAERLPLADANKAHEMSQTHRMTGKIVLLT